MTKESKVADTNNGLLEPVFHAQRACDYLTSKIGQLCESLPPVPESQQQNIDQATEATTRAAIALKRPTFQVAFVGTTAAGKSTLVNGFIGRRICPMEAGETSAGLLTIEHAGEWTFTVKKGEIAAPEDVTEASIYATLQAAMDAQVNYRNQLRMAMVDEDICPEQTHFHVTCPLLPLHETHEFYRTIRGGVGLKVLDLPGLRTINDNQNFMLIQQQIRRAFSFVVIDRTTLFDHEKRQILLKELEETVQSLGGKPSLMIFVLNKVDTRNANDRPISEQVAQASEDITKALRLNDPARVIPFSALSYFHGARLKMALLEGQTAKSQAQRKDFLYDCRNSLENHLKEEWAESRKKYKEQRRRLWDIQDDTDDGVPTMDEDLMFLADLAIAHSGHEQLWATLQRRLGEQLAPLLIFPHSNLAIKALGKLTREIHAYCNTQLVETEEDLEKALQHVDVFEEQITKRIESTRETHAEQIKQLVSMIKAKGDASNRQEQERMMEAVGVDYSRHEDLYGISDVINNMVAELEKETLDPLKKCLVEEWGSRELEKAYGDGPGAEHAEALGRAYENLKAASFQDFAQDGYKDRLKEPDIKKRRKFTKLRKALLRLFQATRKILAQRAERALQEWGAAIGKDVADVTRLMVVKTWGEIRDSVDREVDYPLTEHLSLDHGDVVDVTDLQVPMEVIKIPEPELFKDDTINEPVDWKYEDPYATCFKGDLIAVNGPVKYLDVNVPSAAKIHQLLSEGISKSAGDFWDRFFHWFAQQFDLALTGMKKQLEDFIEVVRQGLQERRKQLQGEAEHQQEIWSGVIEQVEEIDAGLMDLKRTAGVTLDAESSTAGEA